MGTIQIVVMGVSNSKYILQEVSGYLVHRQFKLRSTQAKLAFTMILLLCLQHLQRVLPTNCINDPLEYSKTSQQHGHEPR